MSSKDNNFDEMPDLEDFSEELNNMRIKSGKTSSNTENSNIEVKVTENTKPNTNNTEVEAKTNTTSSNVPKKSGGLKKDFWLEQWKQRGISPNLILPHLIIQLPRKKKLK